MRKLVGHDNVIFCTNCITQDAEVLTFEEDILTGTVAGTDARKNDVYVGPGLIDLQVNGINGVDFNDLSLTVDDIVSATKYLLSQGVTSYLPTIITNSDENIKQLLGIINQACIKDRLVNECVLGIHLEGPFISTTPGAKGAHNENYIKAPDWEE